MINIERLTCNPLLSPDDLSPTQPGLEILCTLNPAAVRFGEETLLLVRVGERAPQTDDAVVILMHDPATDKVKTFSIRRDAPDLDTSDPRKFVYRGKNLLTSLSHLRIARSSDGENFTFDPKPAIFPSTPYETFGCEDARITFIDGRYYITYTAVSEMGVAVGLASTTDFVQFQRHGIIFPPYNKDVCIFPQKIRSMYVCRHRPYKSAYNPAAIWTAYSPDLVSWGGHQMTMAPEPGTWMAERVGAGAPPIKTDSGWLEIFHGVADDRQYALGAMLSDLDRPEKLICRSTKPILVPTEDYELSGLLDNVVFSNGLVVDDDGKITIYYGAADSICAAAVTCVDEMVAAAKQ